jgi:hypothetical protein
MGVQCHPTDIAFTNSGFQDFREQLANGIGLSYEDEGDTWESDDPITFFLSADDCGGELSPKLLKAIAPRMRDIVSEWEDGTPFKERGLMLAEAMELLAEMGESMVLF